VALSGGLTGCNLIFGIEGGELTGGTGGGSTTTNQGGAGTGGATTTTNSGGSSVGGSGVGGNGGAGGGGPVGECEPEKLVGGATLDASCGVFVEFGKTGDGQKTNPIGDIQAGANAAVAQGKSNLYICGMDSFQPSDKSLKLPVGLNVYGGLACADWHYDASVIPAIKGHADFPTIILDGTGGARWADINVTAPSAATPGKSSIAVTVDGTSLLAKRVIVNSGNGGVGENGQPFSAPAAQSPAGLAGDGCGPGFGNAGVPGVLSCMTQSGGMQSVSGGAGGLGAPSSSASASAGANGANNTGTAGGGGGGAFVGAGCGPGGVGSTGPIGGVAPMNSGNGAIAAGGFAPADGMDGLLGLNGGGGGGGGGGKGSGCYTNYGGGGGGAGGCGGAGGRGGRGGGASFGYLVTHGSVTLVGGGVTTQRGGTGGAGDIGQDGGLGGNPGGAQSGGTGGSSCQGGPGGKGGRGGPGSGGPGGPASCFALDSGTITLDTTTPPVLSPGGQSAGGAGASQGIFTAPNGANGSSCTSLDYSSGAGDCTP